MEDAMTAEDGEGGDIWHARLCADVPLAQPLILTCMMLSDTLRAGVSRRTMRLTRDTHNCATTLRPPKKRPLRPAMALVAPSTSAKRTQISPALSRST